MRVIFILGLLLVSASHPRSALALNFTEFGALNLAYPSINTGVNSSSDTSVGLSLGLGLSLGFLASEKIEIESGFVFMPRRFSITSANSPRTGYRMTTFQVPILFRYSFSPHLSAGIGPYFAFASGNITLMQNENEQTVGYNDLSLERNEMGVAASFRYRTLMNELISFVYDARLVLTISNLSVLEGRSFYQRDLQSWFGISFIL